MPITLDPNAVEQQSLAKAPLPIVPGASTQPQPGPALRMPITGDNSQAISQARPLATSQPTVPTQTTAQRELARVTAPPPSDPALLHTKANTGAPGYQQIHNPFLRTLATVGNVLESGFLPGAAVATPGTSLHHLALVNSQRKNVAGEDEISNSATKRKLEEAQTENQLSEAESRTPKKNAPIRVAAGEGLWDSSLNKWLVDPTKKDDEKLTEVDPEIGQKLGIHPTADGKYMVPNQALGALLKPKEAATPKTLLEKAMADHPEWTAEQLRDFEAKDAKVPLEQQVIDEHLKKVHPGETMALARQHTQPAPMTDRGENYIDPKTRRLVRVEPGGTVPAGAITRAGENAINTPTTQMRNVGAQATLVHEQTPHMLSEIDRLKNQLGPMAGRWNEFMQGKIGTENPDFAGLRADLLMYSSAVALMHARGRLPENLREEFDRTINNPGQNFENLKSAITHIDGWTAKNMEAMGGQSGNAGGGNNDLGGGVTMDDIRAEKERRKKK